MRCIIVGTSIVYCTRWRSISCSACSASKWLITTSVPPTNSVFIDDMNGPLW